MSKDLLNDKAIEIHKNIQSFISTLEERGFIVQQGQLSHVDFLELCSEGIVDNCLGNNVDALYGGCALPPAPNQDPSPGQDPPIDYDPDNPNNYPANIVYIAPGFVYKLRPDEAIVLIGQTPPPAYYFSFRSYLAFVQNKPDKDYSEVFTTGDDYTGVYHRIAASLGDQLNNFRIWTDNTPGGAAGEPFNSSTIVIITADKSVNQQIRDALGVAGYSSDIINDDIIPLELVNMGLEKGKDTFISIVRIEIPDERKFGEAYMNNLNSFLKVYRITPEIPFANLNPWPVPNLIIRETGTTEFQIVPNAVNDLDLLRNEIIKKYGGTKYNHVDLNTNIWSTDGYEGIFQDIDVLGDDRDAVYFKTDNFQLKTDNDFVILYGINHEQTGKATFCNSCFYGAELLNGVTSAISTIEFKNSAAQYFPEGYENAKYYYQFKMAREINEDCLVTIPYKTGNPSGKAYGVDNHEDAFIGFRVYVDKETKVGPDRYDIIWDRAILFTKKKCHETHPMDKKKPKNQERYLRVRSSLAPTITAIIRLVKTTLRTPPKYSNA